MVHIPKRDVIYDRSKDNKVGDVQEQQPLNSLIVQHPYTKIRYLLVQVVLPCLLLHYLCEHESPCHRCAKLCGVHHTSLGYNQVQQGLANFIVDAVIWSMVLPLFSEKIIFR